MMSLTWEQAHNISIVHYLSKQGHFPVYCSRSNQEYHYHSPIRSDSTPSFHVNVIKNKWHDKGTSKGGDVIDLVAEHQNFTRSQACHWLSQSGLYSGDYHPEYPTVQRGRYWSASRTSTQGLKTKPINPNDQYAKLEADTSFIIDTIQPLQHPVLRQYLAYRGINPSIASRYGLQEINYQLFGVEESNYFALAWQNDSGGCEYNSKAGERSFKGCLGIKDITTINLQSQQKMAVFESALDFWSYLSHYGIEDYQSSAVILNSVSLKNKVLDIVTKYQPSELYLFLDNDTEGRQASAAIMEAITEIPVHDKSSLYASHKDFNDMVMGVLKKH
jgi:hypothetical protein